MRHFAIFVLAAWVVFAAYALGYKKGGQDFVYYEELTNGMLASSVINGNTSNEKGMKQIVSYDQYKVTKSLRSYIENSENVSFLAPYLIPSYSESEVNRRLNYIVNFHKKYGYNLGCSERLSANNEMVMSAEKCYKLQSKINEVLESHSNKSLKDAP